MFFYLSTPLERFEDDQQCCSHSLVLVALVRPSFITDNHRSFVFTAISFMHFIPHHASSSFYIWFDNSWSWFSSQIYIPSFHLTFKRGLKDIMPQQYILGKLYFVSLPLLLLNNYAKFKILNLKFEFIAKTKSLKLFWVKILKGKRIVEGLNHYEFSCMKN